MEEIRFEKFTLLIDGIHKKVCRIKNEKVPELGIKSVHMFWIYKLMEHPDGLTAAELASESMIDRSLVSREIATLKKNGYIYSADSKKYNMRLRLTDAGVELARRISREAARVQAVVDKGITEEELRSFYKTLEKLSSNFDDLMSGNFDRNFDGE